MKLKIKTVVTFAIMVVPLGMTACARQETSVAFDGIYFSASASAPRSDRSDFTVKVRRATKNIKAAAQAGAFEGTKHCVRYFGNSDIAWTVSPDMPDPTAALDGSSLIFRGRCAG